jgi:hypothetical protein
VVVCWPWWLLLIALVGTGLLGAGLCFVWYWWLVSRPRRPS